MHALLVGNYGVGNLGDELLKDYFLTRFPEVQWTVISAHPQHQDVPRLPGGIQSFIGFRWVRTLCSMRSCDAVVFGGGSLFTDSESIEACFLWWLHVKAAQRFRKPVLFAFQGIGPFRTRVGEWWARSALKGATFLSVRDLASMERVSSWGMNKEIILSFDPVFSLISEKNMNHDIKNVLIIIPRKNSRIAAQEDAIRSLRTKETFDGVVVASLQPGDPMEQAVCKKIAERHRGGIREIRTLRELIEVIASGRTILSERYHGSLAALALGKELVTLRQAEGDKHDTLAEARGSSHAALMRRVEEGEEALRRAVGSLSRSRGS